MLVASTGTFQKNATGTGPVLEGARGEAQRASREINNTQTSSQPENLRIDRAALRSRAARSQQPAIVVAMGPECHRAADSCHQGSLCWQRGRRCCALPLLVLLHGESTSCVVAAEGPAAEAVPGESQ